MSRYLLVAMIVMMIFFMPFVASAQEEGKKEEIEYSYGTIVKVDESKNEIVVSEYDWDKDTELTVIYSVTSDTKFENVGSLKELIPETEISLEYIKGEDGKKIAKLISVYKEEVEPGPTEEMPDIPDIGY